MWWWRWWVNFIYSYINSKLDSAFSYSIFSKLIPYSVSFFCFIQIKKWCGLKDTLVLYFLYERNQIMTGFVFSFKNKNRKIQFVINSNFLLIRFRMVFHYHYKYISKLFVPICRRDFCFILNYFFNFNKNSAKWLERKNRKNGRIPLLFLILYIQCKPSILLTFFECHTKM